MKKRASNIRFIQETSSQQSRDIHGQPSSPAPKKYRRTSPARRILRDMLNLPPIRDEGSCWPVLVPRKK